MNVIAHKKIVIGISIALVLASVIAIAVKGLEYGIEFTGGTLVEVSYDVAREGDELRAAIADAGFTAQVQPYGETNYIIKTEPLTQEEQNLLVTTAIGEGETLSGEVERVTTIGPSVGKELRTKSLWALILVSLGIIFFIAYAFRKVSAVVSSWSYGFAAVIALIHDIIIPVGILTLLGTQIDTLYVVGLLSILGLSINDTIVVFDRIRENLAYNEEKQIAEPFETTVNEAIKQTIVRSIATSMTLVVVLLALYFKGPESTQTLSLVLLLGTVIGTYSSIFLASPLLSVFAKKED